MTSLSEIVGDLSILSSRRHNAEELVRGVWDLIIATDDLTDLPNIKSYPIFRERLVALVPRDLLEQEGQLDRIAARLPYLRNNRPRRLYELTERYIETSGIKPLRNIDCPSTGAMTDLVGSGLGWAISCPLMLCRLRLSQERIGRVALPESFSRKIFVTLSRTV